MSAISSSSLCLICLSLLPGIIAASPRDDAVEHLIHLRQQAGLPPIAPDSRLREAAQSHARYLLDNRLISHEEEPGRPGFSGQNASQRAAATGYASSQVTENLSYGQAGTEDSIDALMTGIYHRLAFLDPHADQVGIGIAGTGIQTRYVYDMGSQALDHLCSEATPPSPQQGYYTQVCNNGTRLPAPAYEQARERSWAAAPALILWPAPDTEEASPVFFEESPDPLPDLAVSGNPISVQFNPYWIDRVQVLSFELFDAEGRRVEKTRLLDQASDPNGRLNDHQFALYPLRRLDWASRYRVELTYIADGEPRRIGWHFRTRAPERLRVLTVNESGQTLRVASGSRFAIYLPGVEPGQGLLSWRAQHADAVREIRFIDPATLAVTLGDVVGSRIELSLANGLRFTLESIAGEPLRPIPKRITGNCTDQPASAHYEAGSGLLTLPHVRIDGDNTFDAVLKLATTQPEIVFDLLELRPSPTVPACITAHFDSRRGRLDIPFVSAPGLGDFRVGMRVIQQHGVARLLLTGLEAR